MQKLKILFVLGLLISSGLFLAKGPGRASAAYNVNFTDLWVGKVTPGTGHIGVDIWWPSAGEAYLPCQHSNDAYYDACVLSNQSQTSYYKVMSYSNGTTDFPYGIFIDNQNADVCTTRSWCRTSGNTGTINHGWGRLITDASIEIYPHDNGGNYNPSTNNVGGVRIATNFPSFANGGRYSPNIGDVGLPQIGEANVGRLNGFVTNNGSAVGNGRVVFEAFQREATRTTSTGYGVQGFTSVSNSSGGYYNTGPVPSGTYKIYITDTQSGHKIILDGVSIRVPYERLDFRLEQHCFGYASNICTDPAQ